MPMERYIYNRSEVFPDHVHMLPEIPPKYSVSGIMGYFRYMKGGEMQNFGIETESFGVSGAMLIPQEKTL